jgi:hypothetical protein
MRDLPADFGSFNSPPIWKGRARWRERYFIAGLHVGCATHDGKRFSARRDMTDNEMVGMWMRRNLRDLGDRYRRCSLVTDAFNLEAGHGETVRQLIERQLNLNEFTQPVQCHFHLELPKKTEIVRVEQANVVYAIPEHGDTVDAHAKGKA